MRPGTTLYDRGFWATYVAHAILYVGHALSFRLADFMGFLGGPAEDVGFLVAAGMAGAIAARLILGHAADKFGLRAVWLGSIACYLLGNAIFVASAELGPWLYTGRIIFAIGYAGVLVSSYVSVQTRAPLARRTEAISMIGQSAFLGLVAGSFLGDALIRSFDSNARGFFLYFGVLFAIGLAYALLVAGVPTLKKQRPVTVRPPLRQFSRWPFRAIAVAMALGCQFAVISFFLVGFLDGRGIHVLGPFFFTYCACSFLLRLLWRRLHDLWSPRAQLTLGCTALCLGQLSLLLVHQMWHLALPALLIAFSRTLIEPTVIRIGGDSLGNTERGAGTALMLTAIDSGILLGAPIFALLISSFGGEAPFFFCAAVATVACGLLWLPARRRKHRVRPTTAAAPFAKPRRFPTSPPVSV